MRIATEVAGCLVLGLALAAFILGHVEVAAYLAGALAFGMSVVSYVTTRRAARRRMTTQQREPRVLLTPDEQQRVRMVAQAMRDYERVRPRSDWDTVR